MQNPKDIVPFWNKARQAMADISTEAYNQLDETEGLIVRVRVTPTIEEIESLVLSRGFTLTQEQNRLLWGVDSKLVYTCPLQHNE